MAPFIICPIAEGNRLPRGPVKLLGRYPNDLLLGRIDVLRAVVRAVRARHPFQVDAWIVFADHLHCVWTLPPVDDDFPDRRRLIKLAFSCALPLGGGAPRSASHGV